VGTEHVLLALLVQDGGTAADVLKSSGVTYEQVRDVVVRMMGLGVDSATGELPFTGPAQDAIALAREEASRGGQAKAGTEHILLALVEERNGAAVRILLQLDVDPAAIRSALSS
jgi:ATP-dependent Clp protease ATP-binding subunit ClpC